LGTGFDFRLEAQNQVSDLSSVAAVA
jgi:hypothetical protein